MRWNPQAEYGSESPEPRSFKSLRAWFDYMRAEGFNVPVQVPWAIQRAERAWGFDSQEAFEWLKQKGLLFVYQRGVTVEHGEEQLTVAPADAVRARVRARQNYKIEGVSLRISWPRTAPQSSSALAPQPATSDTGS